MGPQLYSIGWGRQSGTRVCNPSFGGHDSPLEAWQAELERLNKERAEEVDRINKRLAVEYDRWIDQAKSEIDRLQRASQKAKE